MKNVGTYSKDMLVSTTKIDRITINDINNTQNNTDIDNHIGNNNYNNCNS